MERLKGATSRLDALGPLPEPLLRALADSLRGGPLSVGVTPHAIQTVVGHQSTTVLECLDGLRLAGFAPDQLALLMDALAEQRRHLDATSPDCTLVLSGPDVDGAPAADTGATMQTLIAEAQRNILLVGYTIHNGSLLFEPLARRMAADPQLSVTLCIDIGRGFQDTTRADEIVQRFADEFRAKHWPWSELPNVYYDPRSLLESSTERSSLHAKCVVIDRQAALITSANFTAAAQQRNIEAGVLLRRSHVAAQLAAYCDALIASRRLIQCSV